jgi:hypothetical protein
MTLVNPDWESASRSGSTRAIKLKKYIFKTKRYEVVQTTDVLPIPCTSFIILKNLQKKFVFWSSVVDPDSMNLWIRIELEWWIRIRIHNPIYNLTNKGRILIRLRIWIIRFCQGSLGSGFTAKSRGSWNLPVRQLEVCYWLPVASGKDTGT